MLNLFKKFFDYNKGQTDRLAKRVIEINELEDKARKLKDADFAKETSQLKKQIQSEEKTLDEALPWAYALVREAARRTLGQRHFDEQLIAAVALHEGKVAEQKTGEGKTLSATPALYLNALTGKGVHLVTVNDYLARRDAGWMGEIFNLLGLTVSAMISEESFIYDPDFIDDQTDDWRIAHLKPISRQEAYQADITYGINSEFGFDYLRDNMSYSVDELRQRGFFYAIIDEVDSVLIDEARTPHIISAPYEQDVSKYYDYARLVKTLNDSDYLVDEKMKSSHLTDAGVVKIEKTLGVDNIYEKDYETLFHIEAALKARTLFKKDKDYIVKDDEVIIVDEFTGRLLQGRRYSEGLHQAIEAKEGVAIKRESRTLATVSLQNYFRMYEKLAGMTGTAATEAEEFNKIYGLDVVVVPTHRPMVRQDQSDLIYKTETGKFKAVADTIAAEHKKGRPVLVGTTSIEKNELLSSYLKKRGIPHQLLNAKNHASEAHIIANGGKKGAVTVATNMAGRGVDIVLGGEQSNKDDKKMLKWEADHEAVIKSSGLFVIGTERHESRRIDNQLRGRSGRQGDPGETRFFVSLEDDLMRIFGGEQVAKMMDFLKIPEDQPLENSMVTKVLEQAQAKVEGFNFDTRKHLVEYDDVLNKQREIIYRLRRGALQSETDEKQLAEIILKTFNDQVTDLVNMFGFTETQPDPSGLVNEYVTLLDTDKKKLIDELSKSRADAWQEILTKKLQHEYQKKKNQIGEEIYSAEVRSIYLTTIDRYWTEHLTAIEDLREGINLRGYAQLDPLVEYKNEAFTMFEKLLDDIDYDIARRILKIQATENPVIGAELDLSKLRFSEAGGIDPFKVQEKPPEESAVKEMMAQGVAGSGDQISEPLEIGGFKVIPPGTESKKPGRNDPCWCGSGKKYKKCHYPD